jgi:hypothetical protein
LAADLLPQLEQFGGGKTPAGDRLFAADLLALRGPMGRHRVPDLAATHLAHPEKVARHRQRRAAGENQDEREG